MKHFFLAASLISSSLLHGRDAPSVGSVCHQGNFAFPSSQQPGPLISFGENIIGRNQLQIYIFGDAYIGQKQYAANLTPSVLYGITDRFSLFLNIPFGLNKDGPQHSAGIEDLFLQFEYALYNEIFNCASHQVTFVFNTSFPTGSSHKKPPTGFGAVAYFIGTTYNYTGIKWFCFTSYGVELPMRHNGIKFGNQYLYQFGLGKTVANTREWLFAWMTEIDGTFFARNQIHNQSSDGGNVIYLTPSFWASSKDWVLQLGAGYAVQQNLFGVQPRNEWVVAFNVGLTLQ